MRKKMDKKQKIESGGHAVNTVICPKFITQSSYIPPNKRGKAKDFHDTKSKQA